jgi:transcriptional regulator with PAS, ATPase and Fis domain
MIKILLCWVGLTDINAAKKNNTTFTGPIVNAIKEQNFDRVVLLSDLPNSDSNTYIKWVTTKYNSSVELINEKLSSPTNFGEIYTAAIKAIKKTHDRYKDIDLTYHLSPGTPAMAAVWIIISKTRFPAKLIESSIDKGVQIVSFPFDIAAEFIPNLLKKPDNKLKELSSESPPDAPAFSEIIYKSRTMERVILKAQKIAIRSVPVLIEGESGTGKELLARAIHNYSPRVNKPFIAVNCGAIPSELVESEFFGHEKGAFTGANQLRKGHFELANKGTLFLDEIGELPFLTQVKLLRVLQEGEIVRVGSTKPIKIDVRIIAATNLNLQEEMINKRFRADLYYRVAVAVLKLPALKNRPGDIGLLIEHILKKINKESIEEPGYKYKKISTSAKNIMINHSWPGNIREMINTLRRAAIWSQETIITSEDMREAIISLPLNNNYDILNRPFGEEFDLQEIISIVVTHYLSRAMNETYGNKTKASKLLGLQNYQTLSNWIKKYKAK